MASEKTCYWLAVVILALLVGNNVMNRHEDFIRGLGDRAFATTQQLPADSTRFAALADVMFGRASTRVARMDTAMACAQTRFASMQNVLTRQQMAFAKIDAQRVRSAAIEQMSVRVSCPRQALRMVIPQPRVIVNSGTI